MASENQILETVNTIAKFQADLHNLLEVMGKSDVVVMPAGSAVNVYKEGTKANTTAAAKGAEIPLDGAVPVLDHAVTLTWDKKREIASYEDIQVQGYDACVGGTADTLLKRSAATVRTAICNAIKSGSTTVSGTYNSVQAAAAAAVAKLIDVTADEAGETIFFMNPATFAAYAAVAHITTQTAYGMQYLQGFLGMGNAVVLPGLADNKIYATTCENINLCAASIGSIANVMTDANGVLGISIVEKPENAGVQVCVYNGVSAFLNITNRCCIATYTPAA